MKALRLALIFFAALLLVIAAGIGWMHLVRPGLDAYAAHRYVPPPAGDPSQPRLTATWLGVTGLLLSDGEQSVLVDPFFTRPEGWLNLIRNGEIAPDEETVARWLSKVKLRNLEAVLVSHSHYDHAMDAGVVARIADAVLVGSESTANIGRGSGVPDSQMLVVKPGEPVKFGAFTFTFILSKHAGATGGRPTGDIAEPLKPPARYLDYRQGGTYSILIEHPAGTVLHHGSAGFIPGALKDRKADVVFLGIALRGDLEPYLREVVDAVGARRVIPVHWDDFTRPLSRPLIPLPFGVRLGRFFDETEKLRPDLQVQTLEVGEPVPLF